jgi:hypothetical protein
VVRTRTTVLQAHTHHWLASFGNPGNGQDRVERRRALAIVQISACACHLPISRAIMRFDGQYGTTAVLMDRTDVGSVTRGKDSRLLDQAAVQARLTLPPDQPLIHPESGIVRTLSDCPDPPLDQSGEKRSRVVIATHPSLVQRKAGLA